MCKTDLAKKLQSNFFGLKPNFFFKKKFGYFQFFASGEKLDCSAPELQGVSCEGADIREIFY